MKSATRLVGDPLKSEGEYRIIVHSSKDSFWKVDPDGRILDCNQAACDILGFDRDELLALALHEIDAIEDRAEIAERIRRIIAQGHQRFETRHRHKDGHSIDVEVSAYYVPGAEGGRLFAFLRDITASKAARKALHESEAALRRSEERIRSILRTAPLGIGLLVDRVFVEVNETFASMTGYAAEELIGHSARMLYPTEEDFEYVGREKYRQIREAGIGRVETRFRTKEGRIIDVALSSAPVMLGDLTRGITCTAQDITAMKRTQQDRQAREAMQRDTLVREVHHRIKNHLQGVLGLIRNTMAEHPELAGVMETIVAQVRAIAQVYGLQSAHDDARVRLCDLLRMSADSLAGPMPVVFHNPSEGMEVILAPEEAVPMALVINELLTNAMKHVAPRGLPRPVTVALEVGHETAIMRFRNGPVRLPPEFDFAGSRGLKTGLGLLTALLPAKGVRCDIGQDGDDVVAELICGRPVISEIRRSV